MYLGKVDISPGATEMYDDNYKRYDGIISVIISSWQIRQFRLYSKSLLGDIEILADI